MSRVSKKITVIGLGYIGLPTAAVLADRGYNVSGVDLNDYVVSTVNSGNIHIVEPRLDLIVRSAVLAGRLKAFNKPQAADIYIICVPTPFQEHSVVKQPNIDYVVDASISIAPLLKRGDLIILESTSPVGTTERVQGILRETGVNIDDIHIAYCPERVLPGKAMSEIIENDRIVGGITLAATAKAAEFYRSFVVGDVLETDAKTAEMCKLTENSFRDVNIAFANELSMICDKEGINVWDLIRLANRHPRVNILQPGTGVGGHCIAVDPWFIVARDAENARLIRMARQVNDLKTEWVKGKIQSAARDAVCQLGRKPKIACLGLAFKPNIDDLREAPASEVAEALLGEGYDVVAVEPNISSHSILSIVPLEACLERADIIAVLVKHDEFMSAEVINKLKRLNVLDFCGVFS